MRWFKGLSSVIALVVLFLFGIGNLHAEKKTQSTAKFTMKCTPGQKKALKKGHKKVRHALGHLNVTKNVFGKNYTSAVSHTQKAHEFLNTMRGKNKKPKGHSEYKNHINMCKAEKNLIKAQDKLVATKIGACWNVPVEKVQTQLTEALKYVSAAITAKGVKCPKKKKKKSS